MRPGHCPRDESRSPRFVRIRSGYSWVRTCSPMWRMPRRTAQTVRWSSVVPGEGSQLATAAQVIVRSPDVTAPTSARTPASVPVLFQNVVGRSSDAWWAIGSRPPCSTRAEPTIDWSTLAESHWRTRRSASGPAAVPEASRAMSWLSSVALPVDKVAGWSAPRTSRTRSCRAVARRPREVARAATSASPTRRSRTLVARLSETAPTRAATSMRGSVSTESVCQSPESPTQRSTERVSGSSGDTSPAAMSRAVSTRSSTLPTDAVRNARSAPTDANGIPESSESAERALRFPCPGSTITRRTHTDHVTPPASGSSRSMSGKGTQPGEEGGVDLVGGLLGEEVPGTRDLDVAVVAGHEGSGPVGGGGDDAPVVTALQLEDRDADRLPDATHEDRAVRAHRRPAEPAVVLRGRVGDEGDHHRVAVAGDVLGRGERAEGRGPRT